MARIQSKILSSESAPVLSPTQLDYDGMVNRMGEDVATQCYAEITKKALDAKQADALNEKIEKLWPDLRRECLDIAIPVETLTQRLTLSGAPTSAKALGVPTDFYREAVRHAHEMRNRFSFADIADHTAQLSHLARQEV